MAKTAPAPVPVPAWAPAPAAEFICICKFILATKCCSPARDRTRIRICLWVERGRPRALVDSQVGNCINKMQNKAEGFMWASYWQAEQSRAEQSKLKVTFRSSSSVFLMRTTRILNRSSSCSSTTPVGDRLIWICFRMRHVSKAGGSFFSMPAATKSMKSSRLMPPVPSPEWENWKNKLGMTMAEKIANVISVAVSG